MTDYYKFRYNMNMSRVCDDNEILKKLQQMLRIDGGESKSSKSVQATPVFRYPLIADKMRPTNSQQVMGIQRSNYLTIDCETATMR